MKYSSSWSGPRTDPWSPSYIVRKVFVIFGVSFVHTVHSFTMIGVSQMGEIEISVVVPVYNEEDNVKPLHKRVVAELDPITRKFELIFVDDGSTDGTLKKIRQLIKKDRRVSAHSFYRNFGKANALATGFEHVKGDIIFTMDGDLQDDPAEFKHFLNEMDKGYDVVSGWKLKRKDPLGKTLPSKLFNYLVRKITSVNVHDSNCGFKAYRREVVKMADVYGEFHRYMPIIAHWRGFRVGEIRVKHHKRHSGKSKYGIERLFKGILDLVTITFLIKRGRSPLYFFGGLSTFTFLLALAGAGWTVVDAVFQITSVEWVFGIGSFAGFLFSLLFLSLGLLSEMMLSAFGHERMTKNFSLEFRRDRV